MIQCLTVRILLYPYCSVVWVSFTEKNSYRIRVTNPNGSKLHYSKEGRQINNKLTESIRTQQTPRPRMQPHPAVGLHPRRRAPSIILTLWDVRPAWRHIHHGRRSLHVARSPRQSTSQTHRMSCSLQSRSQFPHRGQNKNAFRCHIRRLCKPGTQKSVPAPTRRLHHGRPVSRRLHLRRSPGVAPTTDHPWGVVSTTNAP